MKHKYRVNNIIALLSSIFFYGCVAQAESSPYDREDLADEPTDEASESLATNSRILTAPTIFIPQPVPTIVSTSPLPVPTLIPIPGPIPIPPCDPSIPIYQVGH
jgi:hypothetical protein